MLSAEQASALDGITPISELATLCSSFDIREKLRETTLPEIYIPYISVTRKQDEPSTAYLMPCKPSQSTTSPDCQTTLRTPSVSS